MHQGTVKTLCNKGMCSGSVSTGSSCASHAGLCVCMHSHNHTHSYACTRVCTQACAHIQQVYKRL